MNGWCPRASSSCTCPTRARRKLSSPSYYVGEKLPPDCVWTAADAQVEFMADNIPVGAKVFVVSGACGDFWLPLLRERCPALVDTWEIRTEMSETEAKQWATIAATNPNTPLVWVVMFIDGKLSSGRQLTRQFWRHSE
jgi:hypothetical protein